MIGKNIAIFPDSDIIRYKECSLIIRPYRNIPFGMRIA